MKSRVISIATFLLALMVIGEAQSITGTYQMHSVRVIWRNIVRDATHADDTSIDGVYSTWVIPYGGTYIAMDANTDGVADLKLPAAGGAIGAEIPVNSFPEARDPFWLINGLGIDLTVALDQETLDGISDVLRDKVGKELLVSTKVDPSILGGFVAKVGDRVIDGSIRTQFENMRRHLTQGN